MWKSILAATAATAFVASSLVYAQSHHHDGGPDRPFWHLSAEDVAAFTDARVAALKAGLKLTADQEKSWPAFEQAYRDLAKQRADRLKARIEQREMRQGGSQHVNEVSPIERLQKRADILTARGAALKHLADVAAPLYQSLDDSQKRRFVLLARFGHQRREHFGFWRAHREGNAAANDDDKR